MISGLGSRWMNVDTPPQAFSRVMRVMAVLHRTHGPNADESGSALLALPLKCRANVRARANTRLFARTEPPQFAIDPNSEP